MAELTIHSTSVQVPNGDLLIDAYLAEPTTPGSHQGIVVVQEIFGVNAHIRDVTDRIAKQGYIAIAPAIYQRLAPGFEAGYTPEDIKIGREYKVKTKADELLSDIQATLDYLKTRPNLKSGGFGAIGFCFGGHVVYLTAILDEIKATASFYGAGIATLTPGGGAPTITRTPEIKGTLYCFFGNEDASIPASEVEQIEATLREAQVSYQIFRYDGADHGFFCDRRASYNAEAATDAWAKVKDLFHAQLQASE
ncbi:MULTISPECIES: dienelactone hydrolase family protein [unclassified Roseofilum]|uniref:dienelactone hydrolase family protein n=1 Tax=unclassified Roseofilum TaxID=2620099 RepID=UPI000E999FF3|nr:MULTISPECIES: dienelactone hydrolase family protein [unclassified Roseofilum]HBQ98885.1 carboxymethylenebutenolidase [Cyanobacteria bacterium UBA11691]MBP0010078.1 dienelactone hydrolase family protein [Roseofilum sp. Belize Diploria]MBP0014791.1 dienelactone hydrolase family protein [Roseofilum sp. SID3]MBP0024152.1 dienelactone hydrolase family protein [Roseofilum sp. SID2]MBP0034476.1 dienelactone hydrolase family protein [Roseofilum sp. Belize BBD 4]